MYFFSQPLNIAIEKHQIDEVKLILENGAPLDTKFMMISLHFAVSINAKDDKIVKLLLHYGADPNAFHYLEQTPLAKAAEVSKLDIMQSLIDARAQAEAMECDEVPQDVQDTLPTDLEDAKMIVELPGNVGDASKEESVSMDTSGDPVDETSNTVGEDINGKDETDKENDDSVLESESKTEKTDAQEHVVSMKASDTNIDGKINNQVKEESKSGSTPGRKEEFELTFEDEFLIPESISDKEYATSEEMLSNCPWKLGQLAWARMSIYPFWPCIVSHEPSPMKTFQKVQAKGRSKTLMIHVHFFNDHGRHSWIPSHHMIPFNGIEDFRKRAKLITDAIRKKEPKFAAALTIKPNLFSTWQKAVAEAMDVLYELDLTSLESFKIQEKKDLTSNTSEETEVKKKRRSKGDDDGKEVKKARKSTSKKESNTINNEFPNNLNLDTPPVSPSMTPAEYRKVYNKKQKRIQKMVDKLQPPDFEVFYERNYDDVIRRYPESTDEHIKLYLMDTWNRMKDVDKLRYRSAYIVPRDAYQKNLVS